MKNGKIRRFRPRSNKHYSGRRSNGSMKNNSVHNIDGPRNNFFRANNVSKNPHNLERLIPTFIRDNSQNDEYTLFYHMIGQHFDQIWTYIKHITEQKNAHHVRGVSKDLVYNTLKSLGLETFDQFEIMLLIC